MAAAALFLADLAAVAVELIQQPIPLVILPGQVQVAKDLQAAMVLAVLVIYSVVQLVVVVVVPLLLAPLAQASTEETVVLVILCQSQDQPWAMQAAELAELL
jgi:hypothetical protein